jgi:hypothetical protein
MEKEVETYSASENIIINGPDGKPIVTNIKNLRI